MVLKILLPYQVFAETKGVKRIAVETLNGSFGILPNRLDCVAALAPGIFTFQVEGEDEAYVAVDEGVLIKQGAKVFVSVRNAIGGTDLGKLRKAVEQEFLGLDEREKTFRMVLAKLESGFLRRFLGLHRE